MTQDLSKLSRQALLEHRDDLFARMKGEKDTATDAEWKQLDGEYDGVAAELERRDRAMKIAAADEGRRSPGRRIEPDPIGIGSASGDIWTAVRSNTNHVAHNTVQRAVDEACERASFNRGYGSGVACEADGEEIRGLRPGETMYRAATGRDLPPPEERFSLGRFLRGAILRDWKHAEIERRVHQTLQGSLGGFLLQGVVAAFILDKPRAMSTYGRLAQTIPMPTQQVFIPRQTGDLTAAFRVEGGTINASDAAFGGLQMTARPLSALCRITREAVKDIPGLSNQLELAGAKAIALELDRACYYGTGVGGGEPQGAFNDNEISTSDLGGVALTLDNLVDMWGTVAGQNFTPNAWVWPTAVAKQFGKLKSGAGEYLMGDDYPEPLKPLQRLHTTQLTDDVILGDFNEAVLGIRDELEIEILNAGTSGGIDAVNTNSLWIRFTMRADAGLTRGTAFAARTTVSTA